MGVLKSFLVAVGLKKKKTSLLVIGLDNSGKTTIVNNLKADLKDAEVTPTVGFSVETFKYGGTKLTVMDMSGQAKYHKLWQCYYKDAKGTIFVIDAADAARLEEAKKVLSDVFADERMAKLPLLVFANKSDKPTALTAVDVSEKMDLTGTLHMQRTWHIQASSATQGTGIEEGIKWMMPKI